MEQELALPHFTQEYLVTLNETDASLLYKQLREYEKKLDAHKKAKTAPINQALKLIRDEYRDIEEQLEVAIGLVKKHMLTLEASRTEHVVTATKYKDITKLVINNVDEIPRELMKPDEVAITKLLKEGVVVPGCSLVTEKTVSL